MVRRFQGMILASLLLFSLALFSACSVAREGTVPMGTPDHGNGTPAVISTPQSSLQSVSPAPANSTGAFYAFVRNNQLWVALKGAHPVQVTNFDYSKTPNVFWHQPVWSQGDSFIAFITSAHPVGLGGGGCPGPDYGANGSLYVLNTATGQFAQVTLPSVSQNVQMRGTPRIDYWQYIFWEDPTHLLAWYNGVGGKERNTAGLYRYDVNAQRLTPVIPLNTLGVATLFQPQKNVPLLLSMRYSNEQLFYQVVVHPFEQQSQLVIYRHSIKQPGAESYKVLQVGVEPWCLSAQSASFVKPGWDVTPDGEQLVAQMIAANGPSQGVSTIQALNLNDGSTTALFTQAPVDLMNSDLTLTWGPDNQKVVVTAYHFFHRSGPYSATLASPAEMQQYAPNMAGQITWRSDSSAFVVQDVEDVTAPSDVYVFLVGDIHGRLLLMDARNFTWG